MIERPRATYRKERQVITLAALCHIRLQASELSRLLALDVGDEKHVPEQIVLMLDVVRISSGGLPVKGGPWDRAGGTEILKVCHAVLVLLTKLCKSVNDDAEED